jgi:predicted TIM-barrel fold metal-dependent hydrolase
MWASNFPMDKPTVSLPGTIDALLQILGSDADPQRLLRDNACRVYRLTD